ncbi:class II fumarate hydratase [Kordiimonas marina]|uniref:class II fumarate hydratase n=1 Tax=Kordiimonas marina TaxID=2872312 RepID=UPI001FF3D2F1|nr:class II fumarate hydratase [Kordiimonas marina]MCJ9427821.1 class II fumarate hydratase [Kordiimonas marina]
MTREQIETREDRDSLGAVRVPVDRYWGAQTERARRNFPPGTELMPTVFIRALGMQKQAAARANAASGALDAKRAKAIELAASDVVAGKLDDHFPLPVWQSGSGTQYNMNANEVIANRAGESLGAALGSYAAVHPNDHVNMAQSSNDTIPTVMNLAALMAWRDAGALALDDLIHEVEGCASRFAGLVKVGRTHLQDAVPMTLGQEFSAFSAQLGAARETLSGALNSLLAVPQGGTAVGTGLNAPADFGPAFARELSALSGFNFTSADNKFAKIAGHQDLFSVSAALSGLATVLYKLANDVRLLGSGPRAGLGELILPKNEPGSSIMAGKVNPSQAEAMTMVCVRVFGNHDTVTHAAAGGQFQLNAYKPVIIYAVLQSVILLGQAMASFTARCLKGLKADEARLSANVAHSLMVATALVPHIGYDKTAEIVLKADHEGTGLREAALALQALSAADYDKWVDPLAMTKGG